MRQSNEKLILACMKGDIDGVNKALKDELAQVNTQVSPNEGASNACNKAHATPITFAASYSSASLELMDVLLEAGADITIRTRGHWFKLNNHLEKIYQPNPLDLALFFGLPEKVKKLLIHAAIHLDANQQASLLARMPEKNVLLYVGVNFPQCMRELVSAICTQKDPSFIAKALVDLHNLPYNEEKKKSIVDKYIELFFKTLPRATLPERQNIIGMAQLQEHIQWFEELSPSYEATIYINALKVARLQYLLDHDAKIFCNAVVDATTRALPILGKQSLWKQAIAAFLEILAKVFPVSAKTIEFFEKSDASRRIEKLRQDATYDLPPAYDTVLDKK